MATDEEAELNELLIEAADKALSLAALLFAEEEEKARIPRTLAQWAVVLGGLCDDEDGENKDDAAPPQKRSRRVRERNNWRSSAWWIQLQDPDLQDYTSHAAKVFRGRFRVPYPFFEQLVKLATEKRWFSRGLADASGRKGVPVELKVREHMTVCLNVEAEPLEDKTS